MYVNGFNALNVLLDRGLFIGSTVSHKTHRISIPSPGTYSSVVVHSFVIRTGFEIYSFDVSHFS